jgi:predicted nucleic acid-binding protein
MADSSISVRASLCVVDASVAAKWVISEPESSLANDLLTEGIMLVAPSVIRAEVAGAALRRYRVGTMTENVAREACITWTAMLDDALVKLVPVDDLFEQALDLAFKLRHPLTDCFYLAAAMRLDAPLLTADLTFHERAQTLYARVELLAKAA